ncbi:unnamed protein product [Closterium sp. NIES-53]
MKTKNIESSGSLKKPIKFACAYMWSNAPTATAASAAFAAPAATATMASPTVLTFDAEGRAVEFDVWVDDLQLFLFDHTTGVSTAPAATADSTVRSQWTTRDAVARLALRASPPLPLLPSAASCCRTFSLTLPSFLDVQQLGVANAGAAGGATSAGAAGGAAGAGATGGAVGAGAAGGATGAGAAGGGTGAVSAVSGGAARPRPYYVPLLQKVLGLPPSLGPNPPLLSPPPVQSQSPLQPSSPLRGPSPYSGPTRGLTERREPQSRPVSPVSCAESPVRTARAGRVLRPRPPPVPGTHSMTLRPSTNPQRVPLPSPPASSLRDGPDPESDSLRAASPTVTRFLATAIADPLFESSAASALVAELVDFAAACRVDYVTSLVAESASASVCPSFVRGGGTSSHSYTRPPVSPPGFSQRQGVDFFQTFSPTPKMTTLRVLLHVATQRDYELHSLDFSTAFLQGSLHEEIWLHRPPGFIGTTLATLGFAPSTADPSLFLRTDTTLPPFYVLMFVDDLVFATANTEALAHVLQRFGFTYSSPQSTPLPTGHSLSAPPSDEFVEPSGPYPELVGCLITLGMGLVLGGRARDVLTGHADPSWVNDLAMQRSSQGYTFSLGSGSVSWRSTHSSSVLSSSCEAEIYAGAMAAQELRWLTYLLTDLGEAPRSPPVLYVDNKAMLALCQEHILEHRTKHIALRYFLARELQQRGQLRLAYVASPANSDDVFTKALQPSDHQRFCTVLGLVPTLPHLLTA